MRWKLQDLGLVLATEFLGAEDLHFGWFDPGEEATPETLIHAQKRYTDRLLAELPDDAHRVLDAGCGTGTIAERLRAQGREVEGLAPNPDLIMRARERLGAGVPLHESPFETFQTDRPFDAVLMAESCQFIKRVRGLQAAARVVRPGGVLLIADVFRMKPLDRPYLSRGGHRHGIFLHTAASHGFEAELDQDITEAVLPTLALYHEFLSKRIVPSAEAVCRSFGSAYPVVNRMIRFFAGKRLELLRQRYLHQDPDTFRKYRTYRLMRLRFRPGCGRPGVDHGGRRINKNKISCRPRRYRGGLRRAQAPGLPLTRKSLIARSRAASCPP